MKEFEVKNIELVRGKKSKKEGMQLDVNKYKNKNNKISYLKEYLK